MTKNLAKIGYIITVLLVFFLGTFNANLRAEEYSRTYEGEYAKVTITPELTAAKSLDNFNLLVGIEVLDGWHSYWTNPGDSGYQLTIEHNESEILTIVNTNAQTPEIIPFADLVNYGYHGKFYANYNIVLKDNLRVGKHKIDLKVSYLVCKDICVPEAQKVQFDLDIGNQSVENEAYRELFEKTQKFFPEDRTVRGVYNIEDNFIILAINKADISDLTNLYFFVDKASLVKYELSQTHIVADNLIYFKLPIDYEQEIQALTGVLRTSEGSYNIIAESDLAITYPANIVVDVKYLLKLMLYAIIGGMILNFMPCVFPVLSLKCLHIAGQKTKRLDEMKKSAFYYFLGIEVSFVILAFLIVLLKEAGFAIGWGFHMQSPYFVGFLITLFYLIALSLSDILTFNNFYFSKAGYKSKSEAINSFLSGALITIVATPCTAPFMAAAIGFALTQSNFIVYLIFLALGLGLALPIILISLNEAFIRFLPKPGKWLISFKQFLAFPFYLTVIWLLWIFNNLTNSEALFLVLLALLCVTFAIWFINKVANPLIKLVVLVSLVVVLFELFAHINFEKIDERVTSQQSSYTYSAEYSPNILQTLVTENKKVFVNVTADWCITCKYNKLRTFATKEIIELFNRNEIYYVEADWTNYNPEITALLAKYDRSGIPLYLYIDRGEVKVLPQLLSKDDFYQLVKN